MSSEKCGKGLGTSGGKGRGEKKSAVNGGLAKRGLVMSHRVICLSKWTQDQ